MKILIRTYILLSICIIIAGRLYSQADVHEAELVGLPQFFFDALSFVSVEPGISRLDIYVEIPNEALHFIKENDVFRSSYDVTINIYDSVETLVNEKWWTEKIETKDYTQSVSPTVNKLNQRSFLLAPGSYLVAVQIKDNETEKISRLKRKIVVKNFSTRRFDISDVMLVSRLEVDSGKTLIYPNISGNVGNLSDGFYIYFEAYNRSHIDSAKMLVNIRNVKGDVVQSDTFMQPISMEKGSCFHKEKTSQLIPGDYILELQATPISKDSTGLKEIMVNSFHFLAVRWRGMPISITDLDLAVDQLQYIADRDQIEEMRSASSEKRREMFYEFWKKKDPSPGTERNELMEEYYSRVAYANKHFGHYVDGWKTDMGMVYIIFGAPSNIERHPFDIDSKPYEVWTYYELNREFVFIDATGFGDYRLQNPVWDLTRTRPR